MLYTGPRPALRNACDYKTRDLILKVYASFFDWLSIDGSPTVRMNAFKETAMQGDHYGHHRLAR